MKKVATMNRKTETTGLRIVKALSGKEWTVVKEFRQKYFFDKVPIPDPYTWTFDHPEHTHLILYQAEPIVGYAHVQLWPGTRAALRIIVIDEPFRNQGLGGYFLAQCEGWLRTQGIVSFHTESSPKAQPFYIKSGFKRMAFEDPDLLESDPQDLPMGKKL